jgi:hypothetical protein
VLNPGAKPVIAAWKSCGVSARRSEPILGVRRKHMAHNGDEYGIRIIYEDGTVELSGWMNSTEQVVHAMATVHRSQGKTYWLLVRREDQIILECPITDIPPPRYSPHDSQYLVRVRSRDRYASGF